MIKFRLDEILLGRGLTVRGFARSAKLNRITVSRIANNQTHGITFVMIARICDYLEISPGELFVIEDVKEDKKSRPTQQRRPAKDTEITKNLRK